MDYVSPIQFYGRTVIENFSEIPGIPISTEALPRREERTDREGDADWKSDDTFG